MDIVCILNGSANSNRAQATCPTVRDIFARKGIDVEIHIAESGQEVVALAKQAVKNGVKLVVAGGGDGTINAVASVLVNSSVAIGVLPMGTLNHFAQDINIPLDLEAAIDTLITGKITRVDVGQVNEHIFLNNASLGLYPSIVREREELQKSGLGKWLAFITAAVRVLGRGSRLYLSLKSKNHGDAREDTPFVFIGNNEYEVAGLNIGQRKRIDAGRLWVYRAAHATRFQLLRLFVQALWKQPNKQLQVFDAEGFTINLTKPSAEIALDGEVKRLKTPLVFSILKCSLQLVVSAGNPVSSKV